MSTGMKPNESTAPPRVVSRHRVPLAALGVGHPSRPNTNIPTVAINPTAPLNIKSKRSATNKPAANLSDGPQVALKESHNELKAILADPPRRRASSSAIEVLAVPQTTRSVSAPMVYRAPGRSPSPPPTPSPTPASDLSAASEDHAKPELEKKASADMEALAGQVGSLNSALGEHASTLNSLSATVTEIKASQVSSDDVVNGIKMVIEYFGTARAEDRKWIADAVEVQIGEMGRELADLRKFTVLLLAQNETIQELTREIVAIKTEHAQCKDELLATHKLLESTTDRLARLEEFFVEENRTFMEENAHLVEHVAEATAEIGALRQELAGFKDATAKSDDRMGAMSERAEGGTSDETKASDEVKPAKEKKTEDNNKPALAAGHVPGTPAKFRKTHTRTPSTPYTPVVPGMYPRVTALRREGMENSFHAPRPRTPDGTTGPRIPALAPQSPFLFRFK